MAKEESNTPPRDDIFKFVAKTAVIAAIVYFGLYSFDQWMRKKDGPWEVTFNKDANGTPILVINWASRDYSNCTVLFHGDSVPEGFELVKTNYVDPSPLPLKVPFGEWSLQILLIFRVQ